MAKVLFKGNPVHTSGEIPLTSSVAPNFKLVDKDLQDRSLAEFAGKKKVVATVPSLDTGVCSLMTKHLNELAKKFPNTIFMTVSADLPFAQSRFCLSEGVSNVLTLSMMKDREFGKNYGLLLIEGPLEGLLARSVMVLNEKNVLIYSELVSEITKEPNMQTLAQFL